MALDGLESRDTGSERVGELLPDPPENIPRRWSPSIPEALDGRSNWSGNWMVGRLGGEECGSCVESCGVMIPGVVRPSLS